MPDIPSFIDKNDFFGGVMPGYVAVLLVVTLFLPQFLPIKESANHSFSIDFFTAIVFIIAGPAVGYSVRQFHRYIYTIEGKLFHKKIEEKIKDVKRNKESEEQEKYEESERERDIRQYAELRVKATEEEKKELDNAEAGYDFSMSTGLILLTIAVFYMISLQIVFHWINISLIIISIVFFIGATFVRTEVYSPLYSVLIKKHNIK